MRTLILISCMTFLCMSSCQKDDNDSANQTNGKTDAAFNPDIAYGTVTDQEGNIYNTVTIGTKIWMAENLRSTKYNDGTPIPYLTSSDEWSNLIGDDWSERTAYCNYKNTVNTDTIATFGRLYNYYTVYTGKLAPLGWHVATEDDWAMLIDNLGDESIAGGKLKETGTKHWISPNTGATNETGFTALPGSWRSSDGSFSPWGEIGINGLWWESPGSNPGYLSCFIMSYNNSSIGLWSVGVSREMGLSVRCVKD